jgi:hypothetical protein
MQPRLLLLQGFLQEGKPVQVAAFLMLLRAKVPPWHSCYVMDAQSPPTIGLSSKCPVLVVVSGLGQQYLNCRAGRNSR